MFGSINRQLAAAGPLSDQSLGILPGDMPALPQMPRLPGLPQKTPGRDWIGALSTVAGILGDSLLTANGRQGSFVPNLLQQRQLSAMQARQEAQRQQDRQWQVEDRDARLNAPEYFNSGNDRVRFNPLTGQSAVIFDGKSDFEEYAQSLGLQPGTPEYAQAVQDHVLRSSGPTAQAGREEIEGVRQTNRVDLEGLRQRNRLTLKGTPSGSTSTSRGSAGGGGVGRPSTMAGVIAPILGKIAAGKPLTPGEQSAVDTYYRRNGRGGKAGMTGGTMTATDPKTGRKVRWTGKAWAPVN
jgi:hypothetical protein